MSRVNRHYQLPVPSTDSVTDASLHALGKTVLLRFDYFVDGQPRRSGIRFDGVMATQTRSERCCTAWHVGPFDTLTEILTSDWVAQIKEDVAERYRADVNVRHFMIYLDSVGCIELLGTDFEILPEETGSWESTKANILT